MKVNSMGMSIRHEATFLIDRPTGLGDNLLLVFKSDARVWTGEKVTEVTPGGFIVYRKGSQQKYGASMGEYVNHYLHFNCEEESLFDKIALWTDRPGYLQNIDEIENLLKLLSREYISNFEGHGENENLLIELLLRKIAENQCEKQNSVHDAKHLEELTGLRTEMYITPGKYSSVRELAESVNLSLSYFQALYSAYFKISCYEDLINAKISSAKDFLSNSDVSVREIATLCGYDSDTCFMRCFKKKVGMTPTEFRKNDVIFRK